MLEILIALIAGLIVGSFLNVCIHRMPGDLSVARPRRSFCPHCEKTIAWHDNIPILSWLLLRGRCRHCGGPISFRYPLVEAITALLFVLCVHLLGLTAAAAKLWLLNALLVGLVFMDLEALILPDEFTIGGLAAGLAIAWFIPVRDIFARVLLSLTGVSWPPRLVSFTDSVLGALVPAGCLWLGGWIFEKVRHKEGLGFGDVKMMAMVGAFLGIRGSLLTLIVGSVLGSVIGLAYILITRKDASTYELPFGSFLGVAAILVSLAGQRVIGWYSGWL